MYIISEEVYIFFLNRSFYFLTGLACLIYTPPPSQGIQKVPLTTSIPVWVVFTCTNTWCKWSSQGNKGFPHWLWYQGQLCHLGCIAIGRDDFRWLWNRWGSPLTQPCNRSGSSGFWNLLSKKLLLKVCFFWRQHFYVNDFRIEEFCSNDTHCSLI